MQIYKWMPLKTEDQNSTTETLASTNEKAKMFNVYAAQPTNEAINKTQTMIHKANGSIGIVEETTTQMGTNERIRRDDGTSMPLPPTPTRIVENNNNNNKLNNVNYPSESNDETITLSNSPPAKRVKMEQTFQDINNGDSSQSSFSKGDESMSLDCEQNKFSSQDQSSSSSSSPCLTPSIASTPQQQEHSQKPLHEPVSHQPERPSIDERQQLDCAIVQQTNLSTSTRQLHDVDMMDTDNTNTTSCLGQLNSSKPHATSSISTEIEDFSIVARLVTEQIVTRVSGQESSMNS